MILNAILGVFSLVNIRKIVTKPRSDVIIRLTVNRHNAAIGAIRRFVVIPKLLARVLRTPINLGSVGHLARKGIGLSKGVVCRTRTRASVAKTLQQARMGEDRIVIFAGQADLLKLRRHLIGIFVIAQSAKQAGSRNFIDTRSACILGRRYIFHVQVDIPCNGVDQQRSIFPVFRPIHLQAVKSQSVDFDIRHFGARRSMGATKHQRTRHAFRVHLLRGIVFYPADCSRKRHIRDRHAPIACANKAAVHIFMLGSRVVSLITLLLCPYP